LPCLNYHATPRQNEYSDRYKMLLLNLNDADNRSLRARVLSGAMPAFRLVRMSATDLASDVAAARRKEADEALLKAQVITWVASAKPRVMP
jgi:hypothetical protein